MTDLDRDRMRAEDHATLATIRKLMNVFIGGGFLVVFAAAGTFYVSLYRLEQVEIRQDALDMRVKSLEDREGERDTATARLEEKLIAQGELLRLLAATLQRIETKLNGGAR